MRQKKIDCSAALARMVLALIGCLVAFSVPSTWADTDPKFYAVEVSANVQTDPAQITLVWPADPRATAYQVFRKAFKGASWSPVASLPGSAIFYTDSSVTLGAAYEYQISKSTSIGYKGYGYIYAGIKTPATETRGKLVLIVDNTYASELTAELARLQQDLVGDGWTVLRHDVSRNDSPPQIRSLVQADYRADPANTRAVLLFGHVPVPYSGNFNPDLHDNHKGAWPADAYYGDVDGNWTDNSVYTTSAERPRNWNIPGDGKFDQVELPSDVELEVGRVDLSNMTCFANKAPARSEKDLLRQYLNKDHNFRHRITQVERRGLICDNFGERNGEAFAASGWRNFAAFFGASKVSGVPGWNYMPTVQAAGYLWSDGTGGGAFYTCDGVGSSDDFATRDVQTVFTMFCGSYFGDWDNESNFLRAPLGSTTYGLTAAWVGRPHWFFHHMGLGETIGYSTRLSQNNGSGGLYAAQNLGTRMVHIALMGDPTLRLHPVVPPATVNAVSGSTGVALSWGASTDSDIVGYNVYRAASPAGPFAKVNNQGPITTTSYTDAAGSGSQTYMVRAIKLERSGSGTYFNLSQGVFSGASSSGGSPVVIQPTVPSAPSSLSAAAQSQGIVLTWIDAANNETGFAVERRVSAAGSYSRVADIGANSNTFKDSSAVPGTTYSYRVVAYNSAGASAPSNEASATLASAVAAGPAQAVFVKSDTVSSGNWKGVYGGDGFQVMGDTVKYPGYAIVTSNGKQDYVWKETTSDTRALQKANAPDRIASCWYANPEFTSEINLIDGSTHRVTLYCLDWDTNARAQTIEVLEAKSGALLDRQTLTGFNGGTYLTWEIKGDVTFRFAKTSGYNAVLMGMFFDSTSVQLGGSNVGLSSPTLGAPLRLSGKFQLRITGNAGQRFFVQASQDCVHWTQISDVTLTGPALDFVDQNAGSFPTRFYRVVLAQ